MPLGNWNPFADVGEQNRYAEDNPRATYDAFIEQQGFNPKRRQFHRNYFEDNYRDYMAHTADQIFSGALPQGGYRDFLAESDGLKDDWYNSSPVQRGTAPRALFAPPVKWVGV